MNVRTKAKLFINHSFSKNLQESKSIQEGIDIAEAELFTHMPVLVAVDWNIYHPNSIVDEYRAKYFDNETNVLYEVIMTVSRTDVVEVRTSDGKIAYVFADDVVKGLENYYNSLGGKNSIPWARMHSTNFASLLRDLHKQAVEHKKGDGRVPEWFTDETKRVPYI